MRTLEEIKTELDQLLIKYRTGEITRTPFENKLNRLGNEELRVKKWNKLSPTAQLCRIAKKISR